jgi:hypothetical protein
MTGRKDNIMCNGFGGIITMDKRVLFMECDRFGDCSHSDLLKRASIKDNDKLQPRYFVRFEFPDWTEASFRWDEDKTLPGWVDDECKELAVKTLLRVSPAEAEYKKVSAAAWAEFIKTISTITGYVPAQ